MSAKTYTLPAMSRGLVMKPCRSQLEFGPVQSLLIAVSVVLIAVSVFADSIGIGNPGVGLDQLSGVVIGILLGMAGLLRDHLRSTTTWARVLAFIYVAGVLYIGLTPRHYAGIHNKVLLGASSFGWRDFAINTAGFILLGYLLMLSFGDRKNGEKTFSMLQKAGVAAALGAFVSLFVEIAQYYLISGRTSSLIDWAANTLGTLGGIALCVLWKRYGDQIVKTTNGKKGKGHASEMTMTIRSR